MKMLTHACFFDQVVKFADTQKDKEQKKVQQLQTNLWSLAGISSPPPANVLPSTYLTVGLRKLSTKLNLLN
jgi:bruno-like protein